MFPGYEDVTDRIKEEPTWYTINGYPRYGYFKPGECNIYADSSILALILCQSCHKPFLIGQDFDQYENLQVKIDKTKLSPDQLKWIKDDDDIWVFINNAIFAPRALDEDGEAIYKTFTLQEMVEGWGFGDPPIHGCGGDTMGCIEYKSVQVWDRRYGRIVEKTDYSIIKYGGKQARIAALENFKYEHTWFDENNHGLYVSQEEIDAVIARATNPDDDIIIATTNEELVD